jgi:predicted membrane protein
VFLYDQRLLTLETWCGYEYRQYSSVYFKNFFSFFFLLIYSFKFFSNLHIYKNMCSIIVYIYILKKTKKKFNKKKKKKKRKKKKTRQAFHAWERKVRKHQVNCTRRDYQYRNTNRSNCMHQCYSRLRVHERVLRSVNAARHSFVTNLFFFFFFLILK